MSESEIIKVYQEGIQSVVTLVQGLSTQISELSGRDSIRCDFSSRTFHSNL